MATTRTEVDMIVKAIAEGFDKVGADLRKTGKAAKEAGKGAEEGGSAFKKFFKSLGDAQGNIKIFGASLTEIKSGLGLFQGALGQVGQAFESLKAGAAAKQTAESFGFLIEKVGGASDTLQQMRKAVRGTVDDTTLMQSALSLTAGASDELSREMFKVAPQLAEIAKAAVKLNPAVGSVNDVLQALGNGIKKNSPLLIDNTGLVVKIGAANEAWAAANNKTVESMTAENKQMALLTATLQAGDQMLRQVGGTTEAAGDSLARFEARAENLISDLQVLAVDGVLPTLDSLNAIETALDSTSTRTQVYEATLAALTSQYGENNQKTIIVRQALEDWKAELARARDETIGYRSDMEAMAEVYGEAGTAIDATTQSISGMSGAMRETISATDLLAAGSQKLTQQFIFQQAAQDLSADAAIQLGVAMGVLNADTIAVASSIDELKTKYDANADGAISGAESAAGFAREVQKLGASVAELQDREITITVNTILSEIRQDLGEVGESPIAGRLQHGGTIPPNQPAILHPPEVLFNPQSGTTTVMSQSDTQRMLQNMEGGGGGITIQSLTINASGAAEGRAAGQAFVEQAEEYLNMSRSGRV